MTRSRLWTRLAGSDSSTLWAGAAVALRAAAAVAPGGRKAKLWAAAGSAHMRRGRPRRAAEAYERASELPGGRARWAVRAGDALRRDGDWAGALRVWEAAADRRRKDAALRVRIAQAHEHLDDPEAAAAAYEEAIALDATHAGWHYRLGRLRAAAGAWQAAAALFDAALALDPAHAAAHSWRGQAAEHDLSERLERDEVLGLVHRPSGDWETAAHHYAAAAELDPAARSYPYRLGMALVRMGRPEDGAEAFERALAIDPRYSHAAYQFGMSLNRAGFQRPLTDDERARIAGAFTRALAANPGHGGARRRVVKEQISAADWGGASRTAWFPVVDGAVPPAHEALRSFLEEAPDVPAVAPLLEGELTPELAAVPMEWWVPLHCRLLSLGEFVLAYRAKRLMAASTVALGHGPSAPGVMDVVATAQALAYLDRMGDARALLDEGLAVREDERDRLVMRKVRADVALLAGDPEPHREMTALYGGANHPEAERRFREIVEGRSVAIVGPAAAAPRNGEAIDAHDVVVRTKHLRTLADDLVPVMGSRTDLSYYASTSTALFGDEITSALAGRELAMAVFRTATYSPEVPYLTGPGDLRYVPSEFKAGFRGGPMAVLRIVYDLLRYRPERITVFNIDFFLSAEEYYEGYDPGKRVEAKWEELGLVAARALAHDYLADFAFTRTLFQAGLLGAAPEVEALLEPTPDEYLLAMEEGRRAVSSAAVPEGTAQ